jgi:hypothetical protein
MEIGREKQKYHVSLIGISKMQISFTLKWITFYLYYVKAKSL